MYRSIIFSFQNDQTSPLRVAGAFENPGFESLVGLQKKYENDEIKIEKKSIVAANMLEY